MWARYLTFERRSKRSCYNAAVLRKFHVTEGQNTRDQITLCAFHSFLVKVQQMLATYMRRMRNSNLEIRIAGSSRRPQQATRDFLSEIAEAWYLAGSDFPRQLRGSIVLLTLSKILMVFTKGFVPFSVP